MPEYRMLCEVIVSADDAARATDVLRDALCEVNGSVDCIRWVEVSQPREQRTRPEWTAADVLFGGFGEGL